METYNHRLGIGLIPIKDQIKIIYRLAEQISKQEPLSFFLQPELSTPHLTLFQGRFQSEVEFIRQVQQTDFSYLNKTQTIAGLSVWAKKIIFLDCIKSPDIQRAHTETYTKLFSLCEGKSADPQVFEGITEQEQQSFDQTGYPFSLDAYLPHITMAHTKALQTNNNLTARLQQALKESSLGNTLIFEKLVVYRVGDSGKCEGIAYERNL